MRKGRVQLPPIEHVFTEKSTSAKTSDRKWTKSRRELHKKKPKDKIDEAGIERTKTPDLLYADEFNYIHPVYSYELEAPSDSGRDIVLSRKGKRITPRKKRKHTKQPDI